MRKLATFATLALTAASMIIGLAPMGAGASSHREAPLILNDPQADATDVYAWVDANDPTKVNLIANYIPMEVNYGPNYTRFSDDVRYEIKVDNNGDAREDITYRFQFTTHVVNPNTFLYNVGTIAYNSSTGRYDNLNIEQWYDLIKIEGNTSTVLAVQQLTPPVNIGPRSTPNYEALAAAAISDLPSGIRVFAGQRDEPFYLDIGSIFDLLALRPFQPFHIIPSDPQPGVDGLAGFNVHTLALQIPINQLTRCKCIPSGPDDPNAIIGVWTTASRMRRTTLNEGGAPPTTSGPYVQVSRLGNPLVNEVVIPLGAKDRFNNSRPQNDGQFLQYVQNSEVAGLLNFLYPALTDIPTSGRTDLVTVFLTGIAGLNQPPGVIASEEMRLNVALNPGEECPTTPNRLGVIGGDNCGFPNGRRPIDDVVDIEVRAVACGYGFDFPPCVDSAPNNQLEDDVDANDVPFLASFPYLGTPHSGYDYNLYLLYPTMGRSLPEE